MGLDETAVFVDWNLQRFQRVESDISDCMLLQRLSSFISHRNSSEIFSIVSLFLWSMVYSRYWIFELLDGVVD